MTVDRPTDGTQPSPSTARAGGAALRPRVTEAIASALFAELAERGYAGTSMEAVARRAGVGKAALYRRWSGKEAMVLDVVGSTVRSELLEAPDTGALDSDLRAVLTALRTQLGHPMITRIGGSLLAEAATRSTFKQAVWSIVAEPRRAVVADVLTAAVARGELPADLAVELGIDLLFAPLAFRVLISDRPVDDDYFDALVTSTLAALRAARPQ